MQLNQHEIDQLLQHYLNNAGTQEEMQIFWNWVANNPDSLDSGLQKLWLQALQAKNQRSAEEWDKVNARITNKIANWEQEQPTATITTFRKWRWVAAAVLIFAIGLGVYYFNNQVSKSNAIIGGTGGTMRTRGDVAPGMNRAILTINNDQTIDLATNKTGININNTITYNDGEKIADAGQLLQLTTPRGGQYQATLPDGSKVWLNAASSIKFPSTFSDKERKVEVTGEAYFEIAKDATKPFKVVGGGQEIEVLGTSFNINVYNDEPVKKTTLITGSIKITHHNQTAILQPGQQANIPILSILPIRLILVQTNDVIAWKNGFFNLEGVELLAVMKQLQRWYDIEVKYDGPIPPIKFKGKLDRGVPLSDIIKFLADDHIQLRLEGKTLVVSST